ncbi:MAG: chemotaxis protein CheX [Phycisphaerales bacterium]|nr:chemotaxis protein CheX [Phycisphaerales bacterium]
MDATVIRRFIESTQNVFGTMLRSTVTFGAPVPTSQATSCGDVSGIIGFSGDVAGAAVIRMPMATAAGVVKAFTGEDVSSESDDFADAIGELANMICGGAKSNMESGSVSISCPQVVLGKDHKVQKPSDAVSITIPCNSPQGTFAIEISIRAVGAHSSASRSHHAAAG